MGEERRGPRETAILAAFFVLSLTAVGLLLWHEERDALRDPVAKAQRGEVEGASGDSLVAAANFRRALGRLDRRLRSSDVVDWVRLAPTRLDVRARDDFGRQRILSVDPGFEVTVRDFGESTSEGVRLGSLDASAPARFFAEVRRRAPAQPGNLDYLVYTVSPGSPERWLLFLREVPIAVKQWQADAHGGRVRKLGEPA